MKVVRVGTGEDVSEEEARTWLVRILEADGPVATVTIARSDGWSARVERPKRTAQYADPDGAALLTDVLDELAEAGVAVAVLSGPSPIEVATVAVGEWRGDDALVGLDRTVLESDELPPPLETAIDAIEPYETLGSLIRQATTHPDADDGGAVATFTGRVRANNLEDHRTTHLEYEKYDEVADEEMAAIREDLVARDGVIEVMIHHHTGVVEAGEDAVYVVVLAGHREEAFRACRDGIDLLKERVPIFKKEVTESGEYWAHDRP